MRKFWKIFGITLGSIVGVAVIAVAVASYVVFTPKRLTPVVDKVAEKLISCEYKLGNVDLTFISTFPHLGLEIDGLYLINPVEGAQNDTVLSAPKVVLSVDADEFLNNNTLYIYKVDLDELKANIFIDENGQNNFDVFITDSTDNDSTTVSLPFDKIGIDDLQFKADILTFLDKKDSLDFSLTNTQISVSFPTNAQGAYLDLSTKDLNAKIGNEQYAEHLSLDMHLPFELCIDTTNLSATLNEASVTINDFKLNLDGNVSKTDDIEVDMNISSNDWDAVTLLELLPSAIQESLSSIHIQEGQLQIADGTIKGVYNDSVMPLINANVLVKDAKGRVADLPYDLKDVQANTDLFLDLKDDKACYVNINSLSAKTKQSSLTATGNITELLADMLLDLDINLDVNLPDAAYFLPEDMLVKGRAKGNLKGKLYLDDLTNLQFAKGKISSKLNITNLDMDYDSLLVDADKATLSFNIPNKASKHKTTNWVDAKLDLPTGAKVEIINSLKADLKASNIQIAASDILSDNPVIYADLGLQSEQPLVVEMDSMGGTIDAPNLTAYVEYDTKDTINIPTAEATLGFNKLTGFYDNIKADLKKSSLEASITGSKRNKAQPKLTAKLSTDALNADIDGDKITTETLSISASARRNPKKDNILLQWNPRLSFDLVEGDVDLVGFNEKINIPYITFDYSNKKFNISKSQILLGKSDFSLTGEVNNIGAWLDGKGDLEGTLDFTSSYTDVNELMDLTSAEEGSEEESVEIASTDVKTGETTESEPYLVPKNVNLTLNTHIKQAVVFDQLARELGGKIYVQNGILVLEEMGFICNAAKLQLTAMYKTPKKNHIYLGLDYHMLDINIQELVNMIPQIDTMLPMLRSFRGGAEFHLAAETYLNQKYEIKTSTLRGACSIEGKDLVLLDNETFTKISKILMFNKKTENKVDSLSAQITLFKDLATVYPFCISIDNYMAAVGGQHYLDMSFDYHASLLKPLYIGVDIKGTFDDLKILPGKCRYVQDFRPIVHKDVETQTMALKKLISSSLKKTVKEQADEEK